MMHIDDQERTEPGAIFLQMGEDMAAIRENTEATAGFVRLVLKLAVLGFYAWVIYTNRDTVARWLTGVETA